MQVLSRAPTRVDIGGGTLDIYPLCQILDQKATVNFAISLFAEVSITLTSGDRYVVESTDQKISLSGNFMDICACTELPLISAFIKFFWANNLPAFSLVTKAMSPAGAGLGGSSALAVALFGAIMELRYRLDKQKHVDQAKFIQSVQDVETTVLKVPTGCQDHWSALLGGLTAIDFPPGGARSTNICNPDNAIFDRDLVLCFSGETRNSGMNNWAIVKKAFDGDKILLSNLNNIGGLAVQIAKSITSGDWLQAWSLSKQEWELRKKLWPEISTKQTDDLEKIGYANGAILSRVCGAGGGGVMMFIAEPGAKEYLSKVLESSGGLILDGHFSEHGLQVLVQD